MIQDKTKQIHGLQRELQGAIIVFMAPQYADGLCSVPWPAFHVSGP